MKILTVKHLGTVGLISGMLFLTACTPEERAFATGAAVGAIVVASYDYPRYYDRPYYYYHGRYYYGGVWRDGYYHYRGHRYHGGRYYQRYDRRHHVRDRDRDRRDYRDHR